MPLQKITLKPGVNRENTRYTNEGGWYESDKIRFRQGTPEVIGGWIRKTTNTFVGVCRALFTWATNSSLQLVGVGTNLKYYVNRDTLLFDITPIRASSTINNNPFATTNTSTTVVVTDTAHGATVNDYVTFSGATAVGGLTLNNEYQITFIIDVDSYRITAASAASSTATGGGASVTAAYQINTGPAVEMPLTGWGHGTWGSGTWNNSGVSTGTQLRTWTQSNYGEDLVFGPRYGAMYYWDSSTGTGTRAVNATALAGASDVPVVQQVILVSEVSRFVFAFGTNAIGGSTIVPLLIRWSDQEDITNWTPAITNQAGSLTLSGGTEILAVQQVKQEILVWTDTSLFSLQYVGAPYVWVATPLADEISSVAPNGVALGSGLAYWMGRNKFYYYDGRVQTLNCDLRRYIFDDINNSQIFQVYTTANEAFNEIWWFYCSEDSTTVDRYAVYNYLEKVWYHGSLARTAWYDAGLLSKPIAASYTGYLLYQETGVDDVDATTPAAISASITSSEFDIVDGQNFAFIWRMLPDVTFRGSTDGAAVTPNLTMRLLPLNNSGSGYTVPPSVGGSADATVSRIGEYTVDQFTGIIYTRIRARQMALEITSSTVGTTWQMGSPRIDIRPDGRRGG